jgi:hypothetical protein
MIETYPLEEDMSSLTILLKKVISKERYLDDFALHAFDHQDLPTFHQILWDLNLKIDYKIISSTKYRMVFDKYHGLLPKADRVNFQQRA